MPLHPDLQAFLELANTQPKQLSQSSVDEVRQSYNASSDFLDEYDDRVVETIKIAARDGHTIPVRYYQPREGNNDDADNNKAIVFFHGGGYVLGNLDSHHTLCHRLVDYCHCPLFSVDYRLAPEHKFPTAFEDACDAYHALVKKVHADYDADMQIIVAGDSVGATLATTTCMAVKNEPNLKEDSTWVMPSKQILLYPCTSSHQDTESFNHYGEGYLLEAETLEWMFSQYLTSEQQREDWRFAPLQQKKLLDLPPALIILPEFDPLIDEGRMYAKQLTASGVSVDMQIFEGMTHDFARFGNLVPNIVDKLMTDIQAFVAS